MGMDKRTIIAVILAIMVLMGYQYLFTGAKTPPRQQPQQQQKTETKTEEVKGGIAPPALIPPAAQEAAEAKEVKVETDFYIAVFSSKGGTIKRFDLKNYKDKSGNPVSLVKQGNYPPLSIGEKEDFGLSKMNFSVKGSDLI